jgi:pSer/pThr/pTyr-binding forkhead associated (FHA) protein
VDGQAREPLLFLALECENMRAGSARWSLAASDLVLLGRGDRRRARRDGRTLDVSVGDSWMSSRHARLIRVGERWIVEDRGSKNGTVVNGKPVLRAELGDGDLLELGRTILLFRETARSNEPTPDRDQRALRREPRALRTLSASLETILGRARAPLWVRGEPGTETQLVGQAMLELADKRAKRVVVHAGRDPLPPAPKSLLVVEVGELSPPERARLSRLIELGVAHVVCTSETAAVPPEIRAIFGAPLDLMPLRERPEDIGWLLAESLHAADPQYAWAIEPDAARSLFGRRWPENLRELRAAVRRAAETADGGLVRSCDLHPPERAQLIALLAEHAGNVSALARALGRDRSAVRRLLERLAIDPGAYR